MLPTIHESKELVGASPVWGSEDIVTTDIIVPRVRQLQSISKLVSGGDAKPGQMVHSLTGELLADKGQVLEILPLKALPTWRINRKEMGKWAFIRQEVRNAANDNLKFEDFEDGAPIQRIKTLTLLVMLAKRMNSFPFFVDFSKSGFQAGRSVCSIIAENAQNRKPSAARVIGLKSEIKSNKENTWFAYAVAPVRDATQEELATCFKWYQMFSNAQAVQAASDHTADEEKPVQAETGDFATDNGIF